MSPGTDRWTLAWRSPAGGWLLIALGAIAASSAYAGALVLARIPLVRAVLPLDRHFSTLLVLHVELAAGVWFLAMSAVLWSLAAPARERRAWGLAPVLAGAGMLGMAVAPLLGAGRPILSDYLPVLDHPLFLAGGLAFLAGWGGAVLSALSVPGALHPAVRPALPADVPAEAARALGWAALVGFAALAALLVGWLRIPTGQWREGYRVLVWGPGHLLQTMHMLLALAAWQWLGRLAGRPAPRGAWLRWLPALIALPTLVAAALLPWLQGPAPALAHGAYTGLMVWGGSASLLGLVAAWRRPWAPTVGAERRAAHGGAALRAVYGAVLDGSLLLYGSGIVLGFLIRENDAMVPAHYHGAIGGLTLAYMGLAYRLLSALGAAEPPRRVAVWQARLYGAGLLAMMAGLVLAGIPRKIAALQAGSAGWSAWAGLGLMGVGGAAALAGSVAFVCTVAWTLRRARGRRVPALAAGEGQAL